MPISQCNKKYFYMYILFALRSNLFFIEKSFHQKSYSVLINYTKKKIYQQVLLNTTSVKLPNK